LEAAGIANGSKVCYTLYQTHPASDGSIPDWAGLRAYIRNVGIPMPIDAQLISSFRKISGISG